MSLSAQEIADLARGTVVSGDASVRVTALAPLSSAGPADLAFLDDVWSLESALASGAGVVLAGDFAAAVARPTGALVVCPQPRLAFARAGRCLNPPDRPPAGVHPTAIVDPSAVMAEGVSVRPGAVVESGVRMGRNVVIGSGCRIGRGVVVGDDTVLKPNVVVYPGTSIGARVIVHAGSVLGSDGFGYVRDAETGRYEAFPQVGRLVIEDDVEIGALCTVDRGALGETRIRRGTKFDNQVHVAHNVSIGEDVVIAAQTGIAGSSVVEDKVVIAGQVGIADHVRIESGVILGAQCGVPTGDVVKGAGTIFWGTPARPIRQCLRELAAIARMVRRQ
jgi:UDP-3-O-[3-hydroxymyristoyl] glucosamine N-acyltransferase